MIIHFISKDKFATGYINYFKTKLNQSQMFFVVGKYDCDIRPIDMDNVLFFRGNWDLIKILGHYGRLKSSDLIIASGFFSSKRIIGLFPSNLLKKTMIHFWGGDFYGYRRHDSSVRQILSRRLAYRAFKSARALVFLIEGEYEKFVKITGIEKNHYVAPVPPNVARKPVDFGTYRNKRRKNDGFVNIIIGNSATESCHHIEAFEMVEKYRNERIRVFCPLSYGIEDYKSAVIESGRRIFANAFFPIMDFVEKSSYIEFLSDMDVGIFNNDRQQAMGNINLLLALGKKVFLRSDTSMWAEFCRRGYSIYSIDDIKNADFESFASMDHAAIDGNIAVHDRYASRDVADERWKKVLEEMVNIKKTFSDGSGGGNLRIAFLHTVPRYRLLKEVA